jgi:glucan biosynthesis protein C
VLGLPRVRAVEVIGPFAFTIYLYHIFGTAGMRELLQWLEITQIPVLFFASLAAGIGVPVAVHLTAKRFALTRRFVLGKSG